MARAAYGALALRPDELLALTPQEFNQMLEGWRWRDDQAKQRLAYALMWIVNPHLKKKVRFDQIYEPLLGEDEVKKRRAEDHRRIVRERRRKKSQG